MKFQCQKTGKCCRTSTLFIPVTHRDLVYLYRELDEEFDRLVDSLAFYAPSAQPEEQMLAYKKMVVPPIITSRGAGFLALRKQLRTSRCVFLTEDNLCSIYKSRPLSCLMYPIAFVEIGSKDKKSVTHDCHFSDKEACVGSIGSRQHVHAVFSKASLNSCDGIGRGPRLPVSTLTQMAYVYYRDLDEFRDAVTKINDSAQRGDVLSPREVISVLLTFGLKKNAESRSSIEMIHMS